MALRGPSLGVVIPTLRGGERLLGAVASVLAAIPAENRKVVVVADGDEAEGVPGVLPEEVRTVQVAARSGFVVAVNRGVAELSSSAGWVALLNDDVVLHPGWFEALRLDETRPPVGGLACEVRFDPARGIVNSRGIGLTPAGWALEIDSGRDAALPPSGAAILGPAGAAGVYRREVWRDLGGLDPRYWAYGEDVDLAWRMSARRWATELRPGAVVYHAHGATAGQRSPLKSYLASRNRMLLRAKMLEPTERIRHLPSELGRELLWLARDTRDGNGRSWLRGKRDGLRMSASAARAGSPYRGVAVPRAEDAGLAAAVCRKRAVDRLAAGA